MKMVGDKLRDWALSAGSDDEIDKYGRSAFNRYYYAAFLSVRRALMNIDPKWAGCRHKNLPDLLTGKICRKAREHARRLEKKGQLSTCQGGSIINSINICAGDLAQLLESAYAVRRIADYSPEELATIRNNNIQLASCTVRTAQRWPDRAERYAGQLQKHWRQLGI